MIRLLSFQEYSLVTFVFHGLYIFSNETPVKYVRWYHWLPTCVEQIKLQFCNLQEKLTASSKALEMRRNWRHGVQNMVLCGQCSCMGSVSIQPIPLTGQTNVNNIVWIHRSVKVPSINHPSKFHHFRQPFYIVTYGWSACCWARIIILNFPGFPWWNPLTDGFLTTGIFFLMGDGFLKRCNGVSLFFFHTQKNRPDSLE